MPQRDGPRLDGRNGAIWRAYLHGHTQEAIAARYHLSQPRVSQIINAVRDEIPDSVRTDAALLDLERLDLVLTGMMPAAEAGDPRAASVVLRILERRAKALGTDAAEPLKVTIERHHDLEGRLVADALTAALDALPLEADQRLAALAAAQQRLLDTAPENDA